MNYLRSVLTAALILALGCSVSMAVSDGSVSVIVGNQLMLEGVFGGGDVTVVIEEDDLWLTNGAIVDGSKGRLGFGIEADFGPEDTPVKVNVGIHYTPTGDNILRWGSGNIRERYASEELSVRDLKTLEATEASLLEIYSGVLVRPTGRPKFNPYVGAGVTYLIIDAESTWTDSDPLGQQTEVTFSDDERTLAAYINGGARWRFGEKFQIGINGRLTLLSKFELYEFRAPGKSDYFELGAIGSWEW